LNRTVSLLKDVKDAVQQRLVIEFIQTLFDFYVESHHTFLEINPFVVLPAQEKVLVLDWAGKLDPDAR
jgi:succinyl-CoA synthetase beta subunit